MKGFKLIIEKNKNGKTIFRIKEAFEISKPAFESTVKVVQETTKAINRMSKVDLNKLKKSFTI